MKCCEGEEGDDGDKKQVYTYFGKRFAKVYLVCVIMTLSRQQMRYLGIVGENENLQGKFFLHACASVTEPYLITVPAKRL